MKPLLSTAILLTLAMPAGAATVTCPAEFVGPFASWANVRADCWFEVGKATPEFIREMLSPLRTVKPHPLTNLDQSVGDVRFCRVWANGKNGVRVQAAPRGKP